MKIDIHPSSEHVQVQAILDARIYGQEEIYLWTDAALLESIEHIVPWLYGNWRL